MTVDVTDEMVASVMQQLLGAVGPGGSDLVSLQHWLIHSGATSLELRHIVGEFRYWMANGTPTLGGLQGADAEAPREP